MSKTTTGEPKGKLAAKQRAASKKSGPAKPKVPVRPFGAQKITAGGELKMSLVERVYQTLMAAMDRGELAPGSRIIAAEVAQQLDLSRAPVREALAVLAGQGLVELLPDRGAVLRPMEQHDLADMYEVLAPIAALGLKAAAARAQQGDNPALIRAAMSAIRAAASNPAEGVAFFQALNNFHYVANGIAQKPYIDFVMRMMQIEYWNRLLVAAIDLGAHAPQYVINYQRLTDALLECDSRSAEAVILHHCDWCIRLLTPSQDP
ncbi:GntR family transcriptional regulator [Blastomonas sp.]|uniref:GntR family transcriptional regulator n=1 Tax=Blastomonas sp. TaxID=1909299 RepID=UPI00262D8A8D|nr:GntR family transcriptional regulator [Blastomonas sp.]MDM7955756.1 GntR family transcriptional regulator [Blastomonas sp.]